MTVFTHTIKVVANSQIVLDDSAESGNAKATNNPVSVEENPLIYLHLIFDIL